MSVASRAPTSAVSDSTFQHTSHLRQSSCTLSLCNNAPCRARSTIAPGGRVPCAGRKPCTGPCTRSGAGAAPGGACSCGGRAGGRSWGCKPCAGPCAGRRSCGGRWSAPPFAMAPARKGTRLCFQPTRSAWSRPHERAVPTILCNGHIVQCPAALSARPGRSGHRACAQGRKRNLPAFKEVF